jgi:hypothetical protein
MAYCGWLFDAFDGANSMLGVHRVFDAFDGANSMLGVRRVEPVLVKYCKLPVDSASPSGPFVQIENLGIGKTINIYGKDLLMYAADKHTTTCRLTSSSAR